ncbi:hypothetical protein RYX36_007412, partial [Vicia faba]
KIKVAGNKDEVEKSSCSNNREVVSLTVSTYAATPGPNKIELKDDDDQVKLRHQTLCS